MSLNWPGRWETFIFAWKENHFTFINQWSDLCVYRSCPFSALIQRCHCSALEIVYKSASLVRWKLKLKRRWNIKLNKLHRRWKPKDESLGFSLRLWKRVFLRRCSSAAIRNALSLLYFYAVLLHISIFEDDSGCSACTLHSIIISVNIAKSIELRFNDRLGILWKLIETG